MKVLFIVQGEGRGHLFQALALKQLLDAENHTVVEVLVGSNKDRLLPQTFVRDIQAPVSTFYSPDLKYNNKPSGSVNMKKTIYQNLKQTPVYLKSIRNIHLAVNRIKPDVIINFYELLTGFYCLLYRPVVPIISIGHQYLLDHPDFKFPVKRGFQKRLLRFNNHMTSLGSLKKLALSFRYLPDCPDKKLYIIPPLIREEVYNMEVSMDNYILVYLTHHSLKQQIIEWHNKNPKIVIHCFGDFFKDRSMAHFSNSLVFHQINNIKFLQMMAGCRALATTAGFESVSEAMIMNKPVLMVPVPGHYEQACNAIDGTLAGAGIMAEMFDLSLLNNLTPKCRYCQDDSNNWLSEKRKRVLDHILY